MAGNPIKPGEVFGRLTVIAPAGMNSYSKALALCQCSCGNTITCRVNNLRSSTTRSCGCYSREVTSKISRKHGHGLEPEAQVWRDIKKRCNNPNDKNYSNYGGRGIRLHPSWEDYMVFRKEVGLRPFPGATLDRIDNNRGYEPGNVRWATMKVQARNKRSNVFVSINGETKTCADWRDALGMGKSQFASKIRSHRKYGVPLEVLLTSRSAQETKNIIKRHLNAS